MTYAPDELDNTYTELKQRVSSLETELKSFDQPNAGREFLDKARAERTTDDQRLEEGIALLTETLTKRRAWLEENQDTLTGANTFPRLNLTIEHLFAQEGDYLKRIREMEIPLFSWVNAACGDHRARSETYRQTESRLEFAKRKLTEFNARMETDPKSHDEKWTYILIVPKPVFETVYGGYRQDDRIQTQRMLTNMNRALGIDSRRFHPGNVLWHGDDELVENTGREYTLNFPEARKLGNPVLAIERVGDRVELRLQLDYNNEPLAERVSTIVSLANRIKTSTKGIEGPEYLLLSKEVERPVANLEVYSALREALTLLNGRVASYDKVDYRYGFAIEFK